MLSIVSQNPSAFRPVLASVGGGAGKDIGLSEILSAANILRDVVIGVTRDPTAILNLIVEAICRADRVGMSERGALCDTLPFLLSTIVEGRIPETNAEWLNLLRATLLNVCAPLDEAARRPDESPCSNNQPANSIPPIFEELSKARVHILAAQRAGQALQELNASPAASPRDLVNRKIEGVAEMLGHAVEAVYVLLDEETVNHYAVITLSRSLVAFEAGDFALGVGAAAAFLRSFAPVDGLLLPRKAVRILTFAAELASAATADEVKHAISHLAQAAASRGNKRAMQHDWLLIVQAYGGAQAGAESANDLLAGFAVQPTLILYTMAYTDG